MRNKRDGTPYETAKEIYDRRLAGVTWGEIRDVFAMNPATAKALLTKHGLEHSPNGANRKVTDKWDRPCITCAKKEVRSKGLFLCKACRQSNREQYDAGDNMYHGYTTSLRAIK